MINYLFDASVIAEFYRPKKSYPNKEAYRANRVLVEHITKQKKEDKAVLFIPSFCIAEVRNVLAKWRFRRKDYFKSQEHYETVFGTFISHVHDRKFFYSYDLNRYHNINTSLITKIEHTTDTEFQKARLPVGTDIEAVLAKLREENPNDYIGKYYLSGLDILIIAMGIELKRITGEEVNLLTKDKRLFTIASKREEFPKPFYWRTLKPQNLPKK